MIINTNIAAMNANRLMNINNAKGQKSMEKLSSGKKINSAADDAAGVGISEKMKSQIRGLEQATLNTQQGIDLIKTSDGAMDEIQSTLQRMRELSVQAASGINTDEERNAIQGEISQLSKQVDSVSKTTEFNTIKTIDGSLRNIPPVSAVETGKSVNSPISIHDDTSASVGGSRVIDIDHGIEIHNGKPAKTQLQLNTPISITDPYNNKITINYVDEKKGPHIKELELSNISIPTGTIQELADVIQNAIDNDIDIDDDIGLKGKIQVECTTNPDSITFKSIIKNSNVKIEMENSPALDEMIGTSSVMTQSLKDPIKISNQSPKNNMLLVAYNDVNGTEHSETLKLPAYDSSTALNHPQDLVDIIQNQINSTPLNGKIVVGVQGDAQNGYKLTLTSRDRGPNAMVVFGEFDGISDGSTDASKVILESNATNKGSVTKPTAVNGTTRNDQLEFTFNDKIAASSTKFDKDNGFTISDSQWTQKTFQINITNKTYNSASDFCKQINDAIYGAGYAGKVNSNSSNNKQIQFTTINEGQNATLQLHDANAAKGSNMFSVLGLNSDKVNGKDKTDTFAIEVNVQYTEKEVEDNDLSPDDIQKLLDNKTVYTPNGYIIQDPLNPYDFIQYTKVQGTGETKQITLKEGEYNTKEDFAKELQNAINVRTNQVGNDVIVTVDSTGGFNIGTPQQNGEKSSVRFVVPPDSNVPGNQSPINTSMDELLSKFLSTTGFDYNRHVGKEGTGKMDIQVGANSNQDVMVKIGSVRAGALGIKYLDVTSSQKASDAISIIDQAIKEVSMERANLGGFQNSFDHIVNNLQSTSETFTVAQSRIEDTDMSSEMMVLTRSNILQQAAQAMLAQANQQPQQVLQLLK